MSFGKALLLILIGAVLLAAAVFTGIFLTLHRAADKASLIAKENDNLNRIYVSVSSEYVDKLFGVPVAKTTEAEGEFTDRFYALRDAVLRTVSDSDGKVLAYFVTSKSATRLIPIKRFYDDKIRPELGVTAYGNVSKVFENPEVASEYTLDTMDVYYSETEGTGRYGMYNSYVFGNVYYGFGGDSAVKLAEAESLKKDPKKVRKSVKPDTYGVIAAGYEDKIGIVPQCDDWYDICYLLKK
ncbi:MAG: hypothetical protein J6U98_05210 [Abditibacteriota bacterium]|nr:hypothetical protein [Abditibacteriota bacterium]